MIDIEHWTCIYTPLHRKQLTSVQSFLATCMSITTLGVRGMNSVQHWVLSNLIKTHLDVGVCVSGVLDIKGGYIYYSPLFVS